MTSSNRASQFVDAVAYTVATPRRLLEVGLGALLSYLVLVLSSFPGYSTQLLAANPLYLGVATTALTENVYRSDGLVSLALVVCYALLSGIALEHLVGQFRASGAGSLLELLALGPGLLAAGCSSCGAGLLGLLGFTGAVAAMPFHGNLLRVAGILLVLYYLSRAGDPRYCNVGATD